MVTLMLPLMVLGCDGASEPSDLCESVDCVAAWAVATWPGAPEEVHERIEGEAAPAVRLGAVMAVVEAHPRTGARLCELLPQGPVSRRCSNIGQRPHLWTVAPQRGPENHALFGEAAHSFDVPIHDPYADLAPLQARCEGVPQTTCQADAALEAAFKMDMPKAARLCKGVPEGKWRSECFFDVAEQLCGATRAGTCSGGARLCLGAGQYRVPCFVDLAGEIATLAPASTSAAASDWAALQSTLRQTIKALSRDNPELARRVESRVWAGAMLRAYASSPAVGTPLRFIPSEAHPHARAAIARRLLSTTDPSRSLEEWGALVEAAEAAEAGAPEPSLPRMRQPVGMWSEVLPQERKLTPISYLGDAARVVHPEPALDRLICILEAAARRPGFGIALLVEAARHPDHLVRWTAVRLLGVVEPSHVAHKRAQEDEEPMVRERALTPIALLASDK